MFRLIRFLVSLAALGALVWFAVTVPLGSKTLVGHMRAILGSRETHDLVEGTKEAARPVFDKVEHSLGRDGGADSDRTGGAAAQRHDPADRRALRKEVRRHVRAHPGERPAERPSAP